jgi:hypothetical protein
MTIGVTRRTDSEARGESQAKNFTRTAERFSPNRTWPRLHVGRHIVTLAKDSQKSASIRDHTGALNAHYRQKAEECLCFADKAVDAHTRGEWIKLATGWTQLAKVHQIA